jgi:hypothetical protein
MRLIDGDDLKEAFYQKMKELLKSTDTPQISNEALSLLCGASLITEAPTVEPDWDYSEETKQITLIVPEDVYNSAETIFLSVGNEGTFGIRGMIYSAQPEQAVKGCRNCKYGKYNDHWKTRFCYNPNECTEWSLWEPSAQPEIKPIEYHDCANAMLKMWIDNVLTDGEYNRIMDKLNAHWGMENG